MSGEKSKPLNIKSNIYCYYFFSKKNKVVREKQREKKEGLTPFSLKKNFLFTKMAKNGGGLRKANKFGDKEGKRDMLPRWMGKWGGDCEITWKLWKKTVAFFIEF